MAKYKSGNVWVDLGIWAGKIVIEKVVDSVVDSFIDPKKK